MLPLLSVSLGSEWLCRSLVLSKAKVSSTPAQESLVSAVVCTSCWLSMSISGAHCHSENEGRESLLGSGENCSFIVLLNIVCLPCYIGVPTEDSVVQWPEHREGHAHLLCAIVLPCLTPISVCDLGLESSLTCQAPQAQLLLW